MAKDIKEQFDKARSKAVAECPATLKCDRNLFELAYDIGVSDAVRIMTGVLRDMNKAAEARDRVDRRWRD